MSIELPKPQTRKYRIGDTVIITGPVGKSSHIGERAEIIDFNYLPNSYRKGYRDYNVTLEILSAAHIGDRIKLLGGYMKFPDEVTPEILAGKLASNDRVRERSKEQNTIKREAIRTAKKIATPAVLAELIDLRRADEFAYYQRRLLDLAGEDWRVQNELDKLVRRGT